MSAENINSTDSDNYIVIKGRFKSVGSNLYGLYMLLLNSNKMIESPNVVISTYSEVYDTEPHGSWDKFEESIADHKWKGNFNANLTTSMINEFKRFSAELRSVTFLYDYAFNYDYDKMDVILFDLINRVLHDKALSMETGLQEVTGFEIKQVKENRSKTKTDNQPKPAADFKIEPGTALLPIKPILSPVQGKPIYELKIGDRIMARIEPKTDRANYYIDTLNLRQNNQIKPVAVQVIDIKAGTGKSNPTEILTEITKGVYGRFSEEENSVKVRVYSSETDGPIEKASAQQKSQPKVELRPIDQDEDSYRFSKGTIVMIILFTVMVSLFAFLMLLIW